MFVLLFLLLFVVPGGTKIYYFAHIFTNWIVYFSIKNFKTLNEIFDGGILWFLYYSKLCGCVIWKRIYFNAMEWNESAVSFTTSIINETIKNSNYEAFDVLCILFPVDYRCYFLSLILCGKHTIMYIVYISMCMCKYVRRHAHTKLVWMANSSLNSSCLITYHFLFIVLYIVRFHFRIDFFCWVRFFLKMVFISFQFYALLLLLFYHATLLHSNQIVCIASALNRYICSFEYARMEFSTLTIQSSDVHAICVVVHVSTMN